MSAERVSGHVLRQKCRMTPQQLRLLSALSPQSCQPPSSLYPSSLPLHRSFWANIRPSHLFQAFFRSFASHHTTRRHQAPSIVPRPATAAPTAFYSPSSSSSLPMSCSFGNTLYVSATVPCPFPIILFNVQFRLLSVRRWRAKVKIVMVGERIAAAL